MSKMLYNIGRVTKGDYKGCYLFEKYVDNQCVFFLDELPSIKYGSVSIENVAGNGGLFDTRGHRVSGSCSDLELWKQYIAGALQQINTETVSKYNNISTSKGEISGQGMLAGSALAGPAVGLASAFLGSGSESLYAVYFKDGKKSLIAIESKWVTEFETALFEF